jgi:hypothetical protein
MFELAKKTYVQQLLKEEKSREINIIVKGYNIGEIANLGHLINEEEDQGHPDAECMSNLEAPRLSRCKCTFSL